MPNSSAKNLPLPGLDVVGRGVYLRPHQVYELKEVLFPRDGGEQTYDSTETGQTYHFPATYAINDSPPLPTRQALNQVLLEESWDRFYKQMGVDANSALSNGIFSVDASASQTKQLRAEEEAYYALRSSFIPLWTVYLPDISRIPAETFDMDIPIPFKHRHRRAYERFFERYGSHYVKRAWVGGKAMLAFTILKSAQLSKGEIQAGIKASMTVFGDSGLDGRARQCKLKLQNNSECTVFGKGGDELKLASLNSLDNTLYNEWLRTIKSNPQVIELEMAGIWTLLHDEEKAKTLMEAYKAATAFTAINAIFNIGQEIYFLRGNGKVYFFRDDQHIRFDMGNYRADPGYPKAIVGSYVEDWRFFE